MTQTRPVWDCQDGLPRNGQGWLTGGQWGGIYSIHGVSGLSWILRLQPTTSLLILFPITDKPGFKPEALEDYPLNPTKV